MSYVSEVADLVHSLNTHDSVLSPHDYLTISEWEKQEIPLSLVLSSLREHLACQEDAIDGSLIGIKQEIRNRYAAWMSGQDPMCTQGDID